MGVYEERERRVRYIIEYRDQSTKTTIEAAEMTTVINQNGVIVALPVIRFVCEGGADVVAMVPLDVVRCVTVEAPALVGA